MAQALYDDRLNNIKTWPNYHTVNYAEQLEEDDNENRVSDHNYVICVKKPPDERVEKFYNGNIPDSLDNYIRRINASYFMTVDNLTKDIWADDSESIEPSETKSPPPYVPNTYAIRRIVKNSVWNNNPDPNKYELIARLGNVTFSGETSPSPDWKSIATSNYNYTGDKRLYAGRRYKILFKVKDDISSDSFTILSSNIGVYSRASTSENISAKNTLISINTSKTFNKGEETYLTYIPTFNDLRYLYVKNHSQDFEYIEIYASYTDTQEVPSNSAIQTIVDTSVWNSVSTTRTDSSYYYYNVASSGAVQNLLVNYIWSKDKAVIPYDNEHPITYSVGDECLFNDTCYRCTTTIDTPESWTYSHWKEIGAENSTGYNLFVPNVYSIRRMIDSNLWTHTSSTEVINSTTDNYYNHYVPSVGAVQNIIKTDLWSSYSDYNKVIPTIGAIRNSIVTSISTSSPSNYKIPTEKAVYDFITQTGAELVTIDGIQYVRQKYYFSGIWYYTLSQAYYLQ